MKNVGIVRPFLALAVLGLGGAAPVSGAPRGAEPTPEPVENVARRSADVGRPTFVSPHASPIAVLGDRVFVVNTPSDTLDVIDAGSRAVVARVNVGVDPVSVAVRPDGRELWVSNHISDSVSVIDIDPSSSTYLVVVATVQEFEGKATSFDEPVGIAFASNEKAYVALSSENQIAVVDVASRSVTKRLQITAQDPRAIAVRGDRLYVLPFESGNQTQLSGGAKEDIDGDLVTFDVYQHSVRNNSILSLGHVVDIVKHPDVPDRDLYVFDTQTDELVEIVESLGTLLYGLAVDSRGGVYIAQTDARNDANGRAGTQGHGLEELENRAFLNRVTRVGFDTQGPQASFFDLEPLPPAHPEAGQALATPFAVQLSDDDSTLFVTAAGSDQLFTVDAQSGAVLGRVEVDAVPRGIALAGDDDGRPSQAWVFNAVENTVSVVDVADAARPAVVDIVSLEDPTHPTIKRGRKAFETAAASSTGTFSCASCHPDGHVDQLLWVLNTPVVTGGDQVQPRTAMPVRGLRDTAPFHWDGIPGDPYGGINAANIDGHDPPNADAKDQTTSTRDLVNGSLANTMHLTGLDTVNDEGNVGLLSAAERDDLAEFILNIPYPPAQRRAYDNVVSSRAMDGFRLYHIDGRASPQRDVCGDCHRFPHQVSTNHPSVGMDTPTWRGAYDRFLILPQGRINIIGLDAFAALAEQGIPEREIWRASWQFDERFDPVWDMVLEHNTGPSGSFARQLTLNASSAGDQLTADLLEALEQSANEEAIVLVGDGVFVDDTSRRVALRYEAVDGDRRYSARGDEGATESRHTRGELIALAKGGKFVGTLTAHHGTKVDADHPQPAIWELGPIHEQRGPQVFPELYGQKRTMKISGRYLEEDANVLVDGRRVEGHITLYDEELVEVQLAELPEQGMHLLQLQNPGGLLSNDFIFHVVEEPAPRITSLGDLFRAVDGDRLMGTWVDAGTRGEGIRVKLGWKIKDHLLEMAIRDKNGATIALVSIDQQTEEITHSAASYNGTTISGVWDLEAEGGPTINAKLTSPEGASGDFIVRFQLQDDDAMILAIKLMSRPFSNISMVRAAGP